MKILLTGTSGQVGGELIRLLPVFGQLVAPDRHSLDLAKPESIKSFLDLHRPDLIVNPAAFTAVDTAETEPDLAYAINAESPAEFARWSAQSGTPLIHYSTDYVYDGSGDQAFAETSALGSGCVYGQSKAAGDQAIIDSGCQHLIFRTSWVYAARGRNFLNTMLRLAQTHPNLRVVNDQVGAPTPANVIAAASLAVIAQASRADKAFEPISGVYHLACSGSGSWYDFAAAIMNLRTELTGESGPTVQAIPTREYPTPAVRPLNSRLALDKLRVQFDLEPPDWRIALETVLRERLGND